MTTVIDSRSFGSGIRTVALVAAISATALSLGSCSSGDDAAPPSSISVITAATTEVVTTVAPTAPPVTTAPETSPVATAPGTLQVTDPTTNSSSSPPPASTTTTTVPTCPSIGGRDGVQSDFPGGPSRWWASTSAPVRTSASSGS